MKLSFNAASVVRRLGTCLWVLWATVAFSQGQTTGRIAGTVRDAQGDLVPSAEVVIENNATGDKRTVATDDAGSYAIALLPPNAYVVSVAVSGFTTARFDNVIVSIGQTTAVNAILRPAKANYEITVSEAPPLVRSDSSEIGITVDSSSVSALPLPTRNFLQLAVLAPGVSMPLTNNAAIGRNSPNFSVNGARTSQNSFQFNGVDASDISFHDSFAVAVPAPESIHEVSLRTSLYDASVSAAGASAGVVTQSGTNTLHGGLYEYFRNDVFNANDPNLTENRPPVLRRNVYGATLGGHIRENKAFFFFSYQGVREANGATSQSLYKDVFIAPGLTDDRSEATLLRTFQQVLPDGTTSINPVALALLNTKLPDGQFLIPTPNKEDGYVSGTAVSTYHEEQFNTNFDFRLGSKDVLATKFFFANAPQFAALGHVNLPGFGSVQHNNNRLVSVQEIHTFSSTAVNEARFGYNFIRTQETTQEPVRDSDLGIHRPTADLFPGLPLILLARDASSNGAQIGTANTIDSISPTLSFTDSLSLTRGRHNLRIGGEFRAMEWSGRGNFFYGEIDFSTFADFLTGSSVYSTLSSGISSTRMRSTDYHVFVQDDWRVTPRLTLNLGLRYELDLPPYDTNGRYSSFEPALYRPRLETADGLPVGPPIGGIVQAGNPTPSYDLPDVPNVGKRLVKSLDPNNLGPRFGFAWSPLNSARLAIRGGYGVFYARPAFVSLGLSFFMPPFFFDSGAENQPFENPFPNALPEDRFPVLQPGIALTGTILDRNVRTPYFQQFNASVQYELAKDVSLQVAYVGTRGLKLFRQVAFNQARIASVRYPIVNEVTGELITVNSDQNASLRAPFQGVVTGPGFPTFNQSDAQSTYHSLQATLNRHFSHGLQCLVTYTFSKSMDNTSNTGGGAFADGTVDTSGGNDTGNAIGNQLDNRSNRGLSDFDRTHRFVASAIWNMPTPGFISHSKTGRRLLGNWQASGIVIAMSGLPVDIFDPNGGSFYGLTGARPNWAPGATRETATNNIPTGYYFNPFAFVPATVQPGQPIPSAEDPTAIAADSGTDMGNVGRNVLRGPGQNNVDFSLLKRFPIHESKNVEFRADFFNLFNHPNRDNPISDISIVAATGSIDPSTGRILNPGYFGKIVGFSSSPRIIQFCLKFNF
jgi:hypothetical protein